MGYKMDHKWQKGMYSGMAADKLKFIQKTGDGKSMAKQTEEKKKTKRKKKPTRPTKTESERAAWLKRVEDFEQGKTKSIADEDII